MNFDQLTEAAETAETEGRVQTARRFYEEGITRLPEHTLFLGYNLGALLQMKMGDGADARAAYERALAGRAQSARLLRPAGLAELEAAVCENLMLLSLSFEEYELWASRLEKLQPENPILIVQRPRNRELRERGHAWWAVMLVTAKGGYDADPAKDPGRYAASASILQLLLLNRRQLRVPREQHRFAVISYATLCVQAWSKCGVAMVEAGREADLRECAVVLERALPLVEESATANPGDTEMQTILDNMREALAEAAQHCVAASQPVAAVRGSGAARAKISWGQVAVCTIALGAAGYFLRDRLGLAWPWGVLVGALIGALLFERVLSRWRARPQGRSGAIDRAQWEHYSRTTQTAGGEPHQLTLDEVSVEGPVVVLVYRWDEDLSYQEADRLDTRARAYASCAIRDAAIGAGLSCEAGPPHGQRPSWRIAGGIPISLMAAGFDVGEKICWMRVGPTLGIGVMASGSESVAAGLAKGFRSHFKQITV